MTYLRTAMYRNGATIVFRFNSGMIDLKNFKSYCLPLLRE